MTESAHDAEWFFRAVMKVRHSVWVKVRMGPWGFLLSRMAMHDGRLPVTSTQSAPLSDEREYFRHVRLSSSTFPSLH